jgi:hypothetical protein
VVLLKVLVRFLVQLFREIVSGIQSAVLSYFDYFTVCVSVCLVV